jgi:uncharacterized protein
MSENGEDAPGVAAKEIGERPRTVSWLRRIAMFPIRVYIATLSWLLGGQCRFTPSCSRYGLEAIEKHGAIKGWWMAIWRVLRCHPFHPGGYDPVPEPEGPGGAVNPGDGEKCGCEPGGCAAKK